jgi:hypothetical protein
VEPTSINWPLIFEVQDALLSRYIVLSTPPRARSAVKMQLDLLWQQKEILRKSQFALLIRQKKVEDVELTIRQLAFRRIVIVAGKLKHLKDLALENPHDLRMKLKDKDVETRWMAIQVVGIKRYPYQSDLIDRLSDPDNSVRQAARQALIRISRGNDFGPAIKANKAERQRAVSRWKQWWALQDSHPRRQLLHLTDQKETGSQGKK